MESRKGRIRSALSFLGFMDVLLDRTMTQPGVRAISGVPKSGTRTARSLQAAHPDGPRMPLLSPDPQFSAKRRVFFDGRANSDQNWLSCIVKCVRLDL